MSRVNRARVATGTFLVALLGTPMLAMAAGSATYSITGITSTLTNDLAVDIPIILAIVGGLMAVVLAIKGIRKLVHF